MNPSSDLSLSSHFASMPDPRIDRTKKHLLGDILIIALCATIAGANSWHEVEHFGHVKLAWLQTFLALPNGIPSQDTFRRVFARIDPKAFNFGQAAVAQGTNEIGTVPELLEILDLHGALVTLDAAGCQQAFAATIRQKKGNYLLCVKGNQEGLETAIQGVFDRAGEVDYEGIEHDGHEEVSPRREHGRHEERSTTVIYDPTGLPPGWPDVAAVVLVGRAREVKGKRTETAHYYITSHRGTASELGRLIRRHWGVGERASLVAGRDVPGGP